MPTFNSQIKITAQCDRNLLTHQHKSDNETQRVEGMLQQTSNSKQQTVAECVHRKVNAPFFPTFSNSPQRNLSQTYLFKTAGESECNVEQSDNDNLKKSLLNQSSKLIIDPSSIQGNLRKLRTRPASQFLEDYLGHGSSGCNKGIESRNKELYEVIKVKARRKVVHHKLPKQKPSKQDHPESIYSTGQRIHPAKPLNPHLKLVKSINSDSHCSNAGSSESRIREPLLQDIARSDFTISDPPYSQKSSVSKNHYKPPQLNSSAAKYRRCKETISNSKLVNSKKILQEDDHENLKKSDSVKKEPDILPDNVDMMCTQSTTSKPDNLTTGKNMPFRDVKARQSNRQQIPKVELKTRGESIESGNNSHTEKLTAKDIKYELKRKQRREIYALNKVMTELENERFMQFMQYAGS